MPSGQFRTHFVQGLERNPNWPLVFINDRQRLFVDITTPQGKRLFEGIFNGKNIYPDEFCKNLIIGHSMLRLGKDNKARREGLDYTEKAMALQPSQAAMQEIVFAARFGELRDDVNEYCKRYLDDFAKNKDEYAQEAGYLQRLWGALISCQHLERIAGMEKNSELAKSYAERKNKYNSEQDPLLRTKRW